MISTNLALNRSSRTAHLLVAVLACCVLLTGLVVGGADARKARAKGTATKRLPLISKVDPKDAAIGDTIKITGKNFVKGKNSMVVILQRKSSKRRFAVRVTGTNTKDLSVKIPDVSTDLVAGAVNTYRIRLISKYGISAKWTSDANSPNLRASADGSAGTLDCDLDGAPDDVDLDDDNDLLSDVIEAQIATDRCLADTDGDGPTDYYEYRVAYEYNGGPTLPYPGKRPYPNPLLADSSENWDGDGLTTGQEFDAWQFTGRMDRFYSDADQDSDGDTVYDELEDEDGDLLPNGAELLAFSTLDWLDGDTDGDILCDGLDDEDHDGPPTAVALGDCVSTVPNAGQGLPGDPNGLIDGDDNRYSNWYEWKYGAAGAPYDPCSPSLYPTSPYCPH